MPNIKAYHRPTSLDEALRLLARPGINSALVGGGTRMIAHLDEMVDEVIDLQAVGLTEVSYSGEQLILGAMVRLQTVVDDHQAPALLREAAHREGPNTFRHAATVGGVVAGAGKESEFLAALLVFEAEVQLHSTTGGKRLPLADFLRQGPVALQGSVITAVSLTTGGKTASDRVGRTPADLPIVAAAARLAPNGQIKLALSGVASTPILIDPDNIKGAVNPPRDFRGSSEYRRQMAATLARRVMAEILNN